MSSSDAPSEVNSASSVEADRKTLVASGDGVASSGRNCVKSSALRSREDVVRAADIGGLFVRPQTVKSGNRREGLAFSPDLHLQ